MPRFRFHDRPHAIAVSDCARRKLEDLTVAELEQLVERDRDQEDVNTLRPANEKDWKWLRDMNARLRDFWSKH